MRKVSSKGSLIGFISIILLCISVSMSYRIAVGAVLVAGFVLLIIFDIINSRLSLKGMAVDISVKGGTEKGDFANLFITLKNESRVTAFGTKLKIKIENKYTGDETVIFTPSTIPAHSREIFKEKLKSQFAGKISCEVLSLHAKGLFGVLPFRKKIEQGTSYVVMPEIFDVMVTHSYRESKMKDNETYSETKRGQDMSTVFQIREYVPGDKINRIHWKLSVKRDEIVVRDGSLPIDKSIFVMWDKGIKTTDNRDSELCERSASTVLSICNGLIEAGLPFEFIWNFNSGKQMLSRTVENEVDLMNAIAEALATPIEAAESRLSSLYISEIGETDANHIIYITETDPKDEARELLADKVLMVDPRTEGFAQLYGEIVLC